MNKKLNLFDNQSLKDDHHIGSYLDTKIVMRNEETGEVIFEGANKLILPGAGFTARTHFKVSGTEITPTYNTAMSLDKSLSTTATAPTYTVLFAVGTDGCDAEDSQVREVDYRKWCKPADLVPFKYKSIGEDIDASLREVYFGRRLIGSDIVAYYFKAFDTTPVFIQRFLDGTPIDSNIYDTTSTEEVESFIELKLKVNKDDCREFFTVTTSINDARINTIQLLSAWEHTDADGFKYYQDIRPLTKLNFPNESLIDLTKGLDITYHIYY